MPDRASHPPPRRRTPAFTRYAALVAEALEATASHPADVPLADVADEGPAVPDGVSADLAPLDLAVLASAARRAVRGLRPPCAGRPAARPYDEPAAAPAAPAADGAVRLDRRG